MTSEPPTEVAQLVESLTSVQKVVSSTLTGPTLRVLTEKKVLLL